MSTSAFPPREASMIRSALRARAAEYRKMAASRKWAGPTHIDQRTRARVEAQAYETLAQDRRLS